MIRLKAVVFPEPFGPISAVILPSSTANAAAVDRGDAAEPLRQTIDREQRRHGATTASGEGVAAPRRAASLSASDGMIPRGINSMTTRNTAE